jgi:hypothetical protein
MNTSPVEQAGASPEAVPEQSVRVRSGVQLCFCSGRQLTPFGQRNRAVQLEIVAIGEMAVEIEVVTDGGVDGGA